MDEEARGAVTADIGANLVVVLVILLMAAGLSGAAGRAPGAARVIAADLAVPLSGKAQSDALFLRLRPDPEVLVVELTAGGAFVPRADGMALLADHPEPWPGRAVVFVFSAKHHAAFRAKAAERGMQVTEVTVPQVLRRDVPQDGVSAFSPAFLAIRAGRDPASIRPPLLRLLQAGPVAGAAGGVEVEAAGQSVLARWMAGLRVLGNALCLALSVWLLFAVRRRWR
ncbi:hypothetical protein C0V75_18050 [Tabrizicola sp. TH137]|uniref:hypothetical protein n=1 Tax=Tabrizicola sp. TH137 TaxID=2067452 RepID=UPI000C7DAFBB|nr:hypothetical protein [Tabrizicola sp. TH137]PLL11183.1 hypothetical protein C0V75_18050 [Tabrizicola sp. TH137]